MIKLLLSFLFISLYACGGADDNSEPPAELVDFESTAEVEELWNVSIGSGDEQQYLKLYPDYQDRLNHTDCATPDTFLLPVSIVYAIVNNHTVVL